MKRYLKNIIISILIILMGVSMFFTMNYAKNHTSNNNAMPNMNNNGGNGNNMGEPPEMPENNNNSSDSNNTNTPPEKPSNDSGEEPPAKPDENTKNNNNTNEPKENSNETTQSTNENNTTKSTENNSGTNNELNANNNQPSEMPSMPNNMNTSLDTKYIIAFGIENFVFGILIMYLIMSNFNKYGIKEAFKNKDKILIYIMSTIIITGGLTYLDSYITKNIFLSNNNNNMNMNNNSNATYSAKTEIKEDTEIDSGEYKSSSSDENALLVSNGTSTLSNITVNKTGDSDGGDNTSFYGTNSAILAKDGSTLNLKNITVKTDATGANGVFSYGGSATTSNTKNDGTTVNISDSKITTTKDNSGGIMTTGGGVMNATNLEINTSGTSSAAIRTDRGGGTVIVNKGTYKTTGQGSPTIYSTADITVKNATLVANASEGVVIEGKNSVKLENVDLTDTNNKLNGKSTTYKNIFLYQSMSGDADTGVSTFTSKNSKITTNKGDTFYITNTSSEINLENNTITNNDSTGSFLRAQADSWGNTGSNGGTVTLNMTNQKAVGNIVIDSISTLTMNLTNKSYYEGVINSDNSAKSITLKLDKTSNIKLTGDSYITSLDNSDSTNSNIDFNGYKLYVNGQEIKSN